MPMATEHSRYQKLFHLCFLYLDIMFHLGREKQFGKSSYEMSLSVHQQVNGKKIWCLYTMKFYLAIKNNEAVSFSGKWLNLKIKQIKQNKSYQERQMSNTFPHLISHLWVIRIQKIISIYLLFYIYEKLQAGHFRGEQRPEQGGEDKWIMGGLIWSMYMKHVSENVMMKLIMLYFEYVPFYNLESADLSTGIQTRPTE